MTACAVDAAAPHLRDGVEQHVEPLVALEPPDEHDQRARIPRRRVRPVACVIDAAEDDTDRRRGMPRATMSSRELSGDGDERGTPVEPRHEPLGADHGRRRPGAGTCWKAVVPKR
jgi:hypothetical protein